MTLKEIFKKVETYNEIAEIMLTHKAKIYFYTREPGSIFRYGDSFESYDNFRKYIKKEYYTETANVILKSCSFEMDKEIEFEYTDYFGTHNVISGVMFVSA